jgi:uncharacterized membrane protein YdjX (TVP38/TMEM64 family)
MMPRTTRAAMIVGLALCVPLVPFFLIGELPGDRWLSAADDHAMRFGLTGAALLASDVLLPIPSSIVGTMLGARLGVFSGFVAAFLGMMVGQTCAYLASRHLLRHNRDTLPAAPTLAVVLLSRPVPVLAEAVALAAGAARLRLPQFLLACATGNALYAAALAFNGAQLPLHAAGPAPLLPMLVPLLVPVIGWLAWRTLRRHRASH